MDANYTFDGVTRLIRASAIPSEAEYYRSYRGHLFCEVPGCPAQLIWVNRQDRPYFRTWPGSKHAADCPHAYETDPSQTVRQPTEDLFVRLTGEHIQQSLKTSHRKQKEDAGLLPKKAPKAARAKPTRPTTKAGGVHLVPTNDPSAPFAEKGMRQPYISQRNCEQLRPQDDGKIVCIRGRVVDGEVRPQSIRLFLETAAGPAVYVSFYHPFRTSSQQAYGLVEDIARRIHSGAIPPFQLNCVGDCAMKEDGYQIQVLHEADFTLNEHSLSSFYRDLPAPPKRSAPAFDPNRAPLPPQIS